MQRVLLLVMACSLEACFGASLLPSKTRCAKIVLITKLGGNILGDAEPKQDHEDQKSFVRRLQKIAAKKMLHASGWHERFLVVELVNNKALVDWVPEETQIRVSRLFAAVPHKNKAKHKTPFDKGQGVEGTAHWLRVKIAQDTARAGRLLQAAEIYERAGSAEPAERKKAEVLQQSIALMTKQLKELEHGNRSKKQRDTKKQTSIQDEGSSAAGEKHSQRGCLDDDERDGTSEDHSLPDSTE